MRPNFHHSGAGKHRLDPLNWTIVLSPEQATCLPHRAEVFGLKSRGNCVIKAPERRGVICARLVLGRDIRKHLVHDLVRLLAGPRILLCGPRRLSLNRLALRLFLSEDLEEFGPVLSHSGSQLRI